MFFGKWRTASSAPSFFRSPSKGIDVIFEFTLKGPTFFSLALPIFPHTIGLWRPRVAVLGNFGCKSSKGRGRLGPSISCVSCVSLPQYKGEAFSWASSDLFVSSSVERICSLLVLASCFFLLFYFNSVFYPKASPKKHFKALLALSFFSFFFFFLFSRPTGRATKSDVNEAGLLTQLDGKQISRVAKGGQAPARQPAAGSLQATQLQIRHTTSDVNVRGER